MEFGAFCLFPYPWPEEAYRILINVILLDSKNIFKIIIFVCQKKKDNHICQKYFCYYTKLIRKSHFTGFINY